jgi:hypothetical protein
MNGLLDMRLSVIGLDLQETGTELISLRAELVGLPVQTIRQPVPTPAPPGTRAGEIVEAGAVLVGLAASPEVVGAVLNGLTAWVERRRRGGLEVRIGSDSLTLHAPTSDQQQKIVDAFAERIRNH